MAEPKPWIKFILNDSLSKYINAREQNLPTLDVLDYSYQNNLSTLRITPKSIFTEIVEVIHAQNTTKGIKALVFDGSHTAHLLCPGTDAQNTKHLQDKQDDIVRAGNVLRLTTPEFRITHCYDLPQVEIHCTNVEPVGPLEIGVRIYRTNADISTDNAIGPLLLRSGPNNDPAMTSNDVGDSPVSFKSQIFPANPESARSEHEGEHDENQESSPMSQMQFATQFHFTRDTSHVPRHHQKDRSPSSNSNTTATLSRIHKVSEQSISSSQKRLLQTFQNNSRQTTKPCLPSNNVHQDVAPDNRERTDLAARSLDKQLVSIPLRSWSPTTSVAQAKSETHTSLDVRHAHAHPPPDQRITSTNRSPVHGPAPSSANPVIHLNTTQTTSAITRESPQMMPDSLIDHFSRWRAEAIAGRYIPRYATKIARDQEAILTSEDRWQPALIGKTTRPGTVPPKLLTHLTEMADRKVDLPIAEHRSVIESINEPCDTTAHGNETEHLDSLNSSQEVPSPYWPSSAVKQPPSDPQLPPDSSPIPMRIPDLRTLREDKLERSAVKIPTDLQDHSPSSQQQTAESASHSVDKHRVNDVKSSHPSEYSQMLDLGVENLKPYQPQVSSSADVSCATQLNNKPLSTIHHVQVHRTPINGKDNSSGHPTFSPSSLKQPPHLQAFPMSSFVPGTYDDSNKQRSTDVSGDITLPPSFPSSFSTDNPEQAINIGKPDVVIRHISNNGQNFDKQPGFSNSIQVVGPSRLKPFTEVAHVLHQESVVVCSPPTTLAQSNVQDKKASRIEASETTENHPINYTRLQNSGKVSSPEANNEEGTTGKEQHERREKDISLQAVDPDYEPVIKSIREYRRSVLAPLSRPRSVSAKLDSPEGTSNASDFSNAVETDDKRSKPGRSPISADTYQASTPLTAHSSLSVRSDKQQQQKRAPKDALLHGSLDKEAELTSLFNIYASTYPDYRGKKEHFAKAVSLLHKLQLSREAPHPYLYDDFLFHHHHSYQQYLVEVLLSSDDALPYRHFYSSHVLSPSHLAGVMKADRLGRQALTPKSSNEEERQYEELGQSGVLNTESRVDELRRSRSTKSPCLLTYPEKTDTKQVDDEEELLHSRHSSVTLWLDKATGGESPELGTPDIDRSIAEIPVLELRNVHSTEATKTRKRKRPSSSSFISEVVKRHRGKRTGKGENSPFNTFFAKGFANLASGKRAMNMLTPSFDR